MMSLVLLLFTGSASDVATAKHIAEYASVLVVLKKFGFAYYSHVKSIRNGLVWQ